MRAQFPHSWAALTLSLPRPSVDARPDGHGEDGHVVRKGKHSCRDREIKKERFMLCHSVYGELSIVRGG